MSTDDMIRQGNKIDELQQDIKDLKSEVRTHLILIKTINEMLKIISKQVGLDDE
jgi:hypothetical protein|tara:strand:+ start:356 stop:517 length:162 start_codon:yes stop_codon:yes gene_type:complete